MPAKFNGERRTHVPTALGVGRSADEGERTVGDGVGNGVRREMMRCKAREGPRFNDDRRAGKGAAISEDLEEKFGRSALRAMKTLEQGRVGWQGECRRWDVINDGGGLVGWAASMEKKLSKV
ncbi:hypothetical protein TIFTF001_024126 [Ficus carica]|uniref:Uncharacterized protein n=1 Tax=Ficus carica TaxID=3494 RepID=A0AA88B0J3_FICCA|nr:hypothetical protein TIFTF001_024126 [Ficus carica]